MQKPWSYTKFAVCLWKLSTLNSFTGLFETTSRMFTGVNSSLPLTSASKFIGGRAYSLGCKTSRRTASCKQLLFRTVCSQWLVTYGRWSSTRKPCLSPTLETMTYLKEPFGISWCKEHWGEKLSLEFHQWPKPHSWSLHWSPVATSLPLTSTSRISLYSSGILGSSQYPSRTWTH